MQLSLSFWKRGIHSLHRKSGNRVIFDQSVWLDEDAAFTYGVKWSWVADRRRWTEGQNQQIPDGSQKCSEFQGGKCRVASNIQMTAESRRLHSQTSTPPPPAFLASRGASEPREAQLRCPQPPPSPWPPNSGVTVAASSGGSESLVPLREMAIWNPLRIFYFLPHRTLRIYWHPTHPHPPHPKNAFQRLTTFKFSCWTLNYRLEVH